MNPLWRCILIAAGIIFFCLFVLVLQMYYTIRHAEDNK